MVNKHLPKKCLILITAAQMISDEDLFFFFLECDMIILKILGRLVFISIYF